MAVQPRQQLRALRHQRWQELSFSWHHLSSTLLALHHWQPESL